jgi:exopolysaccharide biosynthesis WecB/TagA/CpsF family protein
MNSKTLSASPSQTSILGIPVSRTTYQECTEVIIHSAKLHKSCTVAATNVHSIMTGYLDPKGHGSYLKNFTLVTPDGQPVRWALNLLRKKEEKFLYDRVRGPELMLHLCERAAAEGISIFLYGSKESVLENLQLNLKKKFPKLIIAGVISPPFRPLSKEEDAAYIEQIRQSGAGVLFVSLGCPGQEAWAFAHRNQLETPVVCVGAAFDMHAGNVHEAPLWMQRFGLEWFYRFLQEPSRLWKRYLILNPLYLILLFLQLIKLLPLKERFKDKESINPEKFAAQSQKKISQLDNCWSNSSSFPFYK